MGAAIKRIFVLSFPLAAAEEGDPIESVRVVAAFTSSDEHLAIQRAKEFAERSDTHRFIVVKAIAFMERHVEISVSY